jgi:hypothetical protein
MYPVDFITVMILYLLYGQNWCSQHNPPAMKS